MFHTPMILGQKTIFVLGQIGENRGLFNMLPVIGTH